MASICAKCGRKIGAFSLPPLKLAYDEILCNECAEVISPEIRGLYGAKTIEEFDEIKKALLEKSRDNFEEPICKAIKGLTDSILRESIYIDSQFIPSQEENIEENTKENKRTADNYMLTTGYEFEGYKIKKYIGVISGQVVLGTGFLSEFTASFSDFWGIQSEQFAIKLEQAKNAALEKMIVKSDFKGGNAVIGVDFDYIMFSGNMIGVVANGTSVIIEKDGE